MQQVHVWFCGLSLVVSLATAFCQTDSPPITRVVLSQSGLAYIERFGTVDGQATLNLNMKTEWYTSVYYHAAH